MQLWYLDLQLLSDAEANLRDLKLLPTMDSSDRSLAARPLAELHNTAAATQACDRQPAAGNATGNATRRCVACDVQLRARPLAGHWCSTEDTLVLSVAAACTA